MTEPLSELLEVVIDHRGKTPKKLGGEFTESGVEVISAVHIKDGRIDWSQRRRWVSPEMYEKWMPVKLRAGDLLLTSEAPLGEVALVPDDRDLVLSQRLFALRGKVDRLHTPFLYYYFQTEAGQAGLLARATGTTVVGIRQSELLKVSVPVPPLEEQRRIADVLGALDDLIDTNESSRDSLVALVNAEFDRRFALRPLGPTVGELAKVVDCLHSKKPEQSAEGGRILLQLNNIRDDGLMDLQSRYVISAKDYALWSKNLETEPQDLVVTNVGRVGAVARVPVGLTAALGRNMTAIRANDPVGDAAFITAALLSSAVRREIENKTDSGTILNALNVRSIPKLRLQDSTPDERKRFSEWALPLLETCDSLIAHSAQLRRTRDKLLPLLMSGAVRVRPEGVAA